MIRVSTRVDDAKVQVRIRAIDRRSTNLQPVFRDIADDIARVQSLNFATQGGLVGRWEPLAPSTLKRRGPGPIMVRTGNLMESVTTRPFPIERIHRMSMTVGTDVHYAQFHQRGTKRMPQRKVLVMPRYPATSRWKNMIATYILDGRVGL